MPWCPECRTEYRPGFDTCPTCGFEATEVPEVNGGEDPRPRGVRHPVAEAVIRVLVFLALASATSVIVLISHPSRTATTLFLLVLLTAFGLGSVALPCSYTFPALLFLAIGYAGHKRLSPAWILTGWAPATAWLAYKALDTSDADPSRVVWFVVYVVLPIIYVVSITSCIMLGRTRRWAYLVLPVAAFLVTSLVLHLLFFRQF